MLYNFTANKSFKEICDIPLNKICITENKSNSYNKTNNKVILRKKKKWRYLILIKNILI